MRAFISLNLDLETRELVKKYRDELKNTMGIEKAGKIKCGQGSRYVSLSG